MFVPGMEGMSGLTHMTGYPGEPPLLSGHAYGDWVLGATGAAALMVALYHRKKTGDGQYIDVAGREAAACHIGEIIMDCSLNGRDRTRIGNGHASIAPHGCYRCKGDDEWVTIAVENDEQWKRFCDAIGNPSWTGEARFADGLSRWKNQESLDALVEAWTSKYDHYEAMEIMQAAGVPAGAVLNMKEMHLDPHLRKRGFFEVIDHGGAVGKRPIPEQLPAKFSNVEIFASKRAPVRRRQRLRVSRPSRYVRGGVEGPLEEEGIGGIPNFPPARPTRKDLVETQDSGWFDPDYLKELRKEYGEIG